jgi:hypothetical protein
MAPRFRKRSRFALELSVALVVKFVAHGGPSPID